MTDRELLIQGLKTRLAGTKFAVSDNLPFNSAQTPVYTRNFRTLYVSERDQNTAPLLLTLSGPNVDQTQFSFTVYFATDAKVRVADADAVLAAVTSARTVFPNTISSDVEIVSEIEDDIQITTAVYNYSRIEQH